MSKWPEDFALRLPNLRILNMNYNFLEDLSGLEGLQGLRKLMMIGCRLGEERSSSVMRSVRQIGTLEEIDLRYVFSARGRTVNSLQSKLSG